MFTTTIILIIISLLLAGICSAQCPDNIRDSFVSPVRVMDSTFKSDRDRWTHVAYQVEQDGFSEVHLKYYNKNQWTEVEASYNQGISVLDGCIPPDSIVLIEGFCAGKEPKILKQREIVY